MVYPMEGYTTGLYSSYPVGSFGTSYSKGSELGEMVSFLDSHPGHVACSSQGPCFRVARPWYIAMCLVGEGRMSPYAGALCLAYGRSWCKQTPTDGWLRNGTRNGRLCCGSILICSAICVSERQRVSPHVVSLAGRCLHMPRQCPPPLRLPRLFQHRFLVCACAGASHSAPIDLCLPDLADKDFIPSRLQSMWVTTQEYPDSAISPASQSLCLDLDAISSKDSDAKPGDALCASPIT